MANEIKIPFSPPDVGRILRTFKIKKNVEVRGLFDTVLNCTRRRRTADRHMGTAASGLSEEVPQSYIHQSSHKRQAEHLPCRHRQAGAGTL